MCAGLCVQIDSVGYRCGVDDLGPARSQERRLSSVHSGNAGIVRAGRAFADELARVGIEQHLPVAAAVLQRDPATAVKVGTTLDDLHVGAVGESMEQDCAYVCRREGVAQHLAESFD